MKSRKMLFLAVLLAVLLAGCGKKETVYYLPKDQVPQIERSDRSEELPMQQEPDDANSVVTPFVPFDAGQSKVR